MLSCLVAANTTKPHKIMTDFFCSVVRESIIKQNGEQPKLIISSVKYFLRRKMAIQHWELIGS